MHNNDDILRKFGICRKNNEVLNIFKTTPEQYKEWRDRVIDHYCRRNRRWRAALNYVVQSKVPWPFKGMEGMDSDGYPLDELSKILFDWIVDWLP